MTRRGQSRTTRRRPREMRDDLPQDEHEEIVDDPFEGPKVNGDEYIPSVTTRNIGTISFEKFLGALEPYVLERVPEGVMGDAAVLQEVDRLIGRFANIYAYLAVLFGQVGHLARVAKATDKAEYEALMAKKDALYRIIQAVELKWRACSRQVTVETESEVGFERPNYQARADRAQRPMKGWGAVNR